MNTLQRRPSIVTYTPLRYVCVISVDWQSIIIEISGRLDLQSIFLKHRYSAFTTGLDRWSVLSCIFKLCRTSQRTLSQLPTAIMSRDNKPGTEKFCRQVALANKFVPLCLMLETLMWNLLYVTLVTPRILRWLLHS